MTTLTYSELELYWKDFYSTLETSIEERLRKMLSEELRICNYIEAVDIVAALSNKELAEAAEWLNIMEQYPNEYFEPPACISQFV
jgi:hypothetical protein